MDNKWRRKRKFFLLIPLGIAAFLFGMSFIVMKLWNGVLVDAVDNIHTVSYWQAMGLLVLSKILLGGFRGKPGKGGGGPWNRHRDDKWCDDKGEWREKMRARMMEKMSHMDETHKEHLRKKWNIQPDVNANPESPDNNNTTTPENEKH